MWIVFSGRMRSVLRERGKGLNLIVLNGLSLFIVIILTCLLSSKERTPSPFLFRNVNARFLTRFNFPDRMRHMKLPRHYLRIFINAVVATRGGAEKRATRPRPEEWP